MRQSLAVDFWHTFDSSPVSIRAYGAQAAFRAESYRRVDRYTRAQAVYWHLNRYAPMMSLRQGLCDRLSMIGGSECVVES